MKLPIYSDSVKTIHYGYLNVPSVEWIEGDQFFIPGGENGIEFRLTYNHFQSHEPYLVLVHTYNYQDLIKSVFYRDP